MKKMLGKRFMFLVALLVSICMSAMAQRVNPNLTVTAEKTSLQVGESTNLTVTTNSTGTKSYRSNNSKVATVDNNGKVTAVSAGTATITVSLQRTISYNAKSASINITVKSIPTLTIKIDNQNLTSKTLVVDERATVSITTNSSGTKSYTSDNNDVATVSTNGVVMAVGVGETYINALVAETTSYGSASGRVKITVNRITDNNASLTPPSATLTIGGTQQLTFSTKSDGKKSYSSSNSSVATVNSATGLVTAVGAGTATITATAAQTSKYNEVKKTATITVLSPATATVSAENATLAVGGTTQLNVTTNSNGAKTYTSSNNNVATVDVNSGKVTAKSAGTATITVNIAATQTYAATSATVQITVEGPEELNGNGGAVYYIRNVSTGLYIKYGGSYGMDAIEGRAAHPFKLYAKGNETYALASIHGYFNSMYSNSSLFMDRPIGESNWKLVLVDGTTDEYYLIGENDYRLSSVGNQYGILEFRKEDPKDIYQKWQFVTEDKLREEMALATATDPVDVTPFIKGAAFDYADHITPDETDPFYDEILGLAVLQWNKALVESRYHYNEWFQYEEMERTDWTLNHAYINNWDGYKRMEQYEWMPRWSADTIKASDVNLNGIGISRNNIHNEYYIEQFLGVLPAGTYVLSYQGFYATNNTAKTPTVSVLAGQEGEELTVLESNGFKSYYEKKAIDNTIDYQYIAEAGPVKGVEIATMFRDNRENDSYRDKITFTLTGESTEVMIRIHKPYTYAKTINNDAGTRCQWLIAFDDFTLIYQGNENTVVDQSILYYDRVKEAYLYYSKKVSELSVPASYTDPDNDAECNLDGCVHWTAWANAINGVVYVTGVPEDGNPAKVTIPAENDKIAYLNGKAASNKIDTEKEFLEALAKIEQAYQAALKAHNSLLTDFTGLIYNPSFEIMDGYRVHQWNENDATLEEVLIPGWKAIQARWYWDGHTNNNYSGQDRNAVMDAGSLNCHENKYFNSWNGVHGKEAHPIQQGITLTEAGLYELSALVSSYAKGEDNWDNGGAITDYTVFLTAGTYHAGIIPQGRDNFVEHKLLFLVEQDGTEITVGAVGGDGDMFNYYDPRNGGFFRADNFALKKVSDVHNGRVRLALDEVKKTTLDVYGNAALDLTDYENMVNNNLVKTDDEAAIVISNLNAAMKAAVLAQKKRDADMTWAINNPNFETGDLTGWNFTKTTNTWDTGVFPHDIAKASVGADGRYLFNTWDGTPSKCKEITQKISGLRNGTYKLSAMVASDSGNKMTIKAGTASGEVTCVGADKMVEVSCEFTITGGTSQEVTIGVYNNSTWYKADNFRLTYIGHELALNHEVNPSKTIKDWYTDVNLTRNIPKGTWQSFIVPFDMEIPENWDVRDFRGVTLDETGVHLSLIFSEAGEVTKIEAGKPYMVRNDGAADLPAVVVEYKDVETADETLKPQVQSLTQNYTGDVTFTGNYGSTTIPKGAFYISKNKFYIASKDITMKGYRAFFNPDEFVKSTVKSLGMRTRTETLIESVEVDDIEKVVAIYNVNGVQIEKMQSGVNILRMSNGTTKKVIVK